MRSILEYAIYGRNPDFSDDPEIGLRYQFNTPLTVNEEAAYQMAMGPKADDTYDYDMRGFWKSGGQLAGNGHAGDMFKKPNHPTFSDQSQYSNFATPGGHWGYQTFTPSSYNLKNMSLADLLKYFSQVEPGWKVTP